MSAFLKIDRCRGCGQEIPWEWLPPVVLAGRTLTGTGVWRSVLVEGLCPGCCEATAADRERGRRSQRLRDRLIQLLGGIKPYREFTFERFRMTAGNREAFEQARTFNPTTGNLYLWGWGRVGKTHLAMAVARVCAEHGGSVKAVTPLQLVRQIRMKPPEEEQQAIDAFVRVSVLVLDDFGRGSDTAYARAVLQEILDTRDFQDRGGLVVTSRFSPVAAGRRLNDDAITSRLAAICRIIEVKSLDSRKLSPVGESGTGS